MIERTHGRWPWVAFAAAGPATALVWRQRERLAGEGSWVEWLPLVALLWHQSEEWVRPGGFLPWFNRNVAGSDEDEFPITRRDGLVINAGLGWGVGVAAVLTRSPALAAAQLALLAGNVALHASAAARERRYNPGLASALVLFTPLVAAGGRQLLRDGADRRGPAAGAVAGIAASLALLVTMRRRVRLRG